MKKFISKTILIFLMLLFSVLILLYITFNLMPPQFSVEYNASFIDKITYLKSIDEPKIILVGDSNVAFGFRSDIIEKELKMPVVNLGLHGGLPNYFHENMAKLNIQKNDIVILCYSSYSTQKNIDCMLLWTTLESNPELYSFVKKENYYDMFKALPKYVSNKIRRFIKNEGMVANQNCYSRYAFNKYGDNIYPRKKSKYTFNKNTVRVPSISDETAKRINKLHTYCVEKGATLLIAGYPIGYGKYGPSKEKFSLFQKELDTKLKCNIISDFTDYFMDYKYFYDTALHLTDEGAILRTKQLIKDIKNWEK